MKPHEKLQLARIKAGFKSANAAAEAKGFSQSTYYRHEMGITPLKRMAAVYAEAFGVKVDYLLSDRGPSELFKSDNPARVLIVDEAGEAQYLSVKGIWLISQD